MAKTLNELSNELKEMIINLQSDMHNKTNLVGQRYNNLKLTMDPAKDSSAHVVINIAMSEAIFNVKNGEKMSGSLGPDEKYVSRWFSKSSTLESLNECWTSKVNARGKASDGEE